MGYFWGSGSGYGTMFFGGLFMILFWVLAAAGIIFLVKSLSGNGQNDQHSALDVLKSRYAKGEIDKKEFEQKKKDLV